MESDKKIASADKRALLDTIKEYSEYTTIHGLNYIFASFLTLNDRIFWLVIFLAGLVFSVYLSMDAFFDWRQNMIITRFENSELPVTEIDFPAVTVCSQGLNMDNVAKAVERDFTEWHMERRTVKARRRREAEEESLQTLMAIYLKEKFDINEGDPSILDIIQSTSAIGGGGAAKAEAVTKSVKKCSKEAFVAAAENEENQIDPHTTDDMDDMFPYDDTDDSMEARKDCVVMRDWGLLSNNYTVITETGGQGCIHHCYRAPDCRGYTWRPGGTCTISHDTGKYVPETGSFSGRRCSSCEILEMTIVDGETLDKRTGVSLDDCINLCNDRIGCTHFNYYYSKIPTDSWSRCVLVTANKEPPIKKDKNYVLSGERCRNGGSFLGFDPPILNKVSRERGKEVVGSDLKSFSNIKSIELCIDICHKTRKCEGFEYLLGDGLQTAWQTNVCNLKFKVSGLRLSETPNIISGYSHFVCKTSTMENHEAVGQNIAVNKFHQLGDCIKFCRKTESCVGFSYSHKSRLCFIKASIKYFQEALEFSSGRACYEPPTYLNTSLLASASDVRVNVAGSKSPVMSMVMSLQPELSCEDLKADSNVSSNSSIVRRQKRGLNEKIKLEAPPNIDILINPEMKMKREEYEQYVMNKLKNFFKDKNSTKIYPNLFRMLWYTKTPCFDLFKMTGDHAHVLKYCEWAGEEVPCEALFEAVPTDVGICCSFNFNTSLTETIYARLVKELKMKERTQRNISTESREVLKGKVGFDMGLKVVLDSHSNIASPATINSDGDAFQVYIGNPGEFPFLRNRAVQIQPGHENHVEVSGVKISADPAIHHHSLEKRKCKFYDESDLVYHAGYSYSSCVVEFAMRVAVSGVGCVPWYMPQNGTVPICGPWQTSAFQKIMGRAFSSAHSQSGCLPDCHSVKYTYTLSKAKFRRCDQRNLNYSPLCSLSPKFSPPPWQKSVLDIYKRQQEVNRAGAVPSYVEALDRVEREYYPSLAARQREIMESFTGPGYEQTYNAYEGDIAVLYVYFGQPTTTEYIRVVSLSWVGFLAQAGGLIGACLGFSFISLVEEGIT